MKKGFYYIMMFVLTYALGSCSTKIVSTNYYNINKNKLLVIEQTYKALYKTKPFSAAFTDRALQIVSIELITDSLTYIYEIGVDEPRLLDTLAKYGYQAKPIYYLIKNMQSISCAWINNFDYYVNDHQRRLVLISIKPKLIRYLLSPPKYYILAYFDRAQSFDEKSRLLDGKKVTRLRQLNGQTYRKITDRICFTIAEKYR